MKCMRLMLNNESSSLLHMQDRDLFSLKLEDTENWLYEDGEDQQKQVYIDKLAELKVTTYSLYDWTVLWEEKKDIKWFTLQIFGITLRPY